METDNLGRFKKGSTPWNKGLNFTAGGRSRETYFKKGQRPLNTQPIGTLGTKSDGYLRIKVSETGNKRQDWKLVHVQLWESVNGPMPPDHILVFKDKNKSNITIENLELITRSENMRRNSLHRYPPELKACFRQLAKLNRIIKEKEHENNQ